jgi:hypothetical protein
MENRNNRSEFTQNQFQRAAEAGAFSRIVVRAGWSHFSIFGQMRSGGEASLVAQRQKRVPREFRNPAAALALLRQIGVTKAEVEMREWDVEMAALSMRMRPDVTARRLREKRIMEAAYFPGLKTETRDVGRHGELKILEEKKLRLARGTW